MNRIKLIIVMILWGSIGLFTRYIDLTPVQLAFSRAALGGILLLLINGKQDLPVSQYNKKSVMLYILSGALIGIAWVALFYGYANTSIASAVIIYNMCPVYVMLAAPLVLKEKRSPVQTVVIILSLIGLVLIVGNPSMLQTDYIGKIMSSISGLLYAVIVLINRKIKVKFKSNIATSIQMISASLILLPFVINTGLMTSIKMLNHQALLMTLILGFVHTGIAYSLYFSTYHQMKSIDIVVYSYLEPVFGLMFSVIILGEVLSFVQVIGGLLILGSTFIGEYIQAGRSHGDVASCER
jgi:drug/metabolite transporter (DMT)-like permease